ncbi:MAG: CocE/NonD family hydrolase [Acidimicrobiales bacterium]
MVRLPGPPENGPYPTLVEYSGYDPANPYEWGGTTASTRIASLLGYATVGVNLRGSGCSGGSFQLWEDPVATDGYDAVEAIAAQPWVKDHKVGLVGLSYPGNAALYAASTRPPSLAAIAVGGTYDDGFRNLLRPSGILNDGFAQSWINGRYEDAQPAAAGWAKRRIREGDVICDYNQRMREQNVDLAALIDSKPYFPEEFGLGDSFAPGTFVNRIQVPTFLVATWHDEQVGGHVPTMLANFTGTSQKRFLLTNGGHAEIFAVPEVIAGWDEFLDLYVKRETPQAGILSLIHSVIAQQVVGSKDPLTSLGFPADRFTGQTYAQALAAYQAEPQVKVLFENGAGTVGVDPGLPKPAFSASFGAYPVPGTQATRWYFGADGSLTTTAPSEADDAEGTIDTYVSDPSARPRRSVGSGGTNAWAQFPAYDWRDPVDGKSLTYLSPALSSDTVMVGSASVDLWLRSSAADTDLQATLSEVRPDGKEYLVQSGWLRASVRQLDESRSTELQPLVTMRESDAAPLPAGEFTPMRLEIYPFAHVFRAGSKVRLIITAPGGDRLEWQFDTLPGTQTNEVARSVGRPSAVVLPVVPGVSVPTAYPLCPGLRGQPCRDYHAPAPAPAVEAPAPADDLSATSNP